MAVATATMRDVDFKLAAPNAKSVYLAGTFNHWSTSSTPMKKDWKGTWRTTIRMKPGRCEYKFLVDGSWWTDPTSKETSNNPFGGTNSTIWVK